MTKKMVFFDIDGTLLDHGKKLPASAKQAIQALREKGHDVAIATGRAPFMFEDLRAELEIDTYVSYNGQYVVLNNQPIYTNPLNKEAIRSLSDYCSKSQLPLLYMDHLDMKTNIEFHPFVQKSMGSLEFDHPAFDPAYYEARDLYQTILFCSKDEELPNQTDFDHFQFIRWHPLAVDVLPVGGSKAKGIEVLVNQLGIKSEDVYAFGDGLNDLEMLRSVANSVAMGNASDVVKQAAKYVTKDVDEHGIAHGLELVGLL
ncbi:Cof-type HAD-IIB family hydrolase [Brevibacillus ginsengisoli]|uniref:Cof-type HAD-IIB family hydrolase n=1 Tax=Brevibacillus ginsengisoli TaxID=363854 RepID=UPI003CF82BB1